MSLLEKFKDITTENEPLASRTSLKVGGPAQFFVQPRSTEELIQVIQHCATESIPMHLLGGGSNILVRDEGVSGAVIQLDPTGFSDISINGTFVKAGSAALLSKLITESVNASLAGLETLAGIPGTVGGALHGNAGSSNDDIGQFVKEVSVVTVTGELFTRKEDELSFAYRNSSVDELAIVDVTLELAEKNPDKITSRMRKVWITKKASQPLAHQSAGCIFKNPRGYSAGSLIDQAGLKGTKIGNAEISDEHANFIITHENCASADVLKLIDLSRSKISDQFAIDLELEINVW